MFYVSSQAGATYQWQTNNGLGWINLTNFGQYSGVNNDTLAVSGISMSNNNQAFQCIITIGPCTTTSTFALLNVNTSVGLVDLMASELTLFPNPASSNLTIHQMGNLIMESIRIFNVVGEEVMNVPMKQSANATIDLIALKAGIYFIEVKTEQGIARKKFIKE